jgi:enediyne polyketide synthase
VHTIADPIAPMPEGTAPGSNATPIAIVGLACRFPDADDPLALFESALAGRRAFRRLPPGRLGAVAGPHDDRDGARPGSGGTVPRAALIEGWQFDRAGFGIAEHAYQAADPAFPAGRDCPGTGPGSLSGTR